MSRPIDPRLIRAVPSLRRFLVTLGGLQLLAAAAVVAQAALLARVLADIVLSGRPGSLLQPLVLLASTGVARAGLAALQEWVSQLASARVRAELRDGVVRAVVSRGPTWAAHRSAGELATTAGPGLESLDGFVTRALPALVSACVIPPVALAGIGFVDWRSAAILLCVLPLVPIFMALVGLSTGRQMEARYAALARLAGHFLDLVQGLTTLKVYGQATRQVATVREATHAYRRQTMQTLRLAFLSGLVLDLIATLSVAVVAVSVGLRLDGGHLSLQVALMALLLAPEVFAPTRAVGAQHHAAEEGRVAAAAALDLLQDLPAAEPAPAPVPLHSNASLSLQGLSVRYDGRADDALADLHLDLRPGELVVVQGVSGGGKSTLLAVLLGFVAPSRGTVSRSGSTDRLPLDSAQWRAGVAWLPQHPRPTQADVGAEVTLGDPEASPAAVLAAIADCHAPEPATPLGEDGAAVSAGQRRRVALARALLRARSVRAGGGVPLVLLDEPSEDLDRETERVVASVVAAMVGWATVLMVTHSAALAAGAGRRIVLDNGRLVSDLRRAPAVPPHVEARPPTPYRPVEHRPSDGRPSWRPLLSGLPGARRRLAGAALLSGATGLAGLTLTATSIWLICRAAQHPNLQALALAVVGVRTFALAKALLRYAERIVSHDVALRLLAELRARVFAALEPLAPAGLAEFGRGDLLRRFVSDVDGVQEGLVRAVVPLAGAVLTASGAVVVAAVLAPAAAAALAAGLLVALLVAPALALRTAGDAGDLTIAAALRDQRTNALLDGLSELTAYGATAGAIAGIAAAEADVMARSRRPAAGAAIGAAVSGAAAALTLASVLWLASTAAKHGMAPISAGVIAAAVLAGFDALAGLPTAFAALSRLRRGLDRIATLLSTAPLQLEPTAQVSAPAGALTLRLTDLAVAPARAAGLVVRSATLQVTPGSRVALMGPSGCGKTTLLKAALRLLPVDDGEVSLTGTGQPVSLAALSAAQMPPLVAGSLQGDHVFDASLRDNLRVVRPDATDEELDRVAERAGLRGFVRSLPEGWSTAAGADGSSLSGGQRQRLLLARALLAAPSVLVLDEPTAHLDEQTGREVLADLLAGTRGSTVLLSTHRQPDQGVLEVLTFEDGRLHPVAART